MYIFNECVHNIEKTNYIHNEKKKNVKKHTKNNKSRALDTKHNHHHHQYRMK